MKLKKVLKNKIFIFTLFMFVGGMIGEYATTYFPSNDVTYDNTESGLKSENVQEAIDELYNTCSYSSSNAADNLLNQVEIVTSGDGLYEDEYEDRYFYKGTNPNNYIKFSNELWRIISLEGDGTIKIIRNQQTKDSDFGQYSGNYWYGSSVWIYFTEQYTRTIKDVDKIVFHDFYDGIITELNNDLSNQINEEKSHKWGELVGLVTVSEYLRTNSNKEACGTLSKYDDRLTDEEYPYWDCYKTNWIDSIASSYIWTLNSNKQGEEFVVGASFATAIDASYTAGIVPVAYLSSKVKIIDGSGTSQDPYIIE